MENWRNDLSLICSAITGRSSGNWRDDIALIADARGINSTLSWRDALRSIASLSNIFADDWRDILSSLALNLGAPSYLDWRRALRFIRLHYQQLPPPTHNTPHPSVDANGSLLTDTNGYLLLLR